MKHLFLIVVLSFAAMAQGIPNKGDMTIGGNVLFSSTNTPGSSSTIFNLTPQFSYFISDMVEIGGSLSFQSVKSSSTTTSIGVGPFLTAYYTKSNIKPLLGIAYTYANYKVSFSSQTIIDDSKGAFSIYGGLIFPVNDKVAIQPILQYSVYISKDFLLGDVTQIMFGIGMKVFL
jgi:hypothetical protein